MAGILKTALHAAASPKARPEVRTAGLENLDRKSALILFAVAEAVLGEGFLAKCPKFVETVDDYLNYQRPAQRDLFITALLIAETRVLNLVAAGNLRGFSHLSLADRRAVLERLRASDSEQMRNIYAAFVNVSAATFYASELTWPDLGYPGVSVDHPQILEQKPVPWRPDDPRPVEP